MELDRDSVAAVFPPMQERGASRSRPGGRLVLVRSERLRRPGRADRFGMPKRNRFRLECASIVGGAIAQIAATAIGVMRRACGQQRMVVSRGHVVGVDVGGFWISATS